MSLTASKVETTTHRQHLEPVAVEAVAIQARRIRRPASNFAVTLTTGRTDFPARTTLKHDRASPPAPLGCSADAT